MVIELVSGSKHVKQNEKFFLGDSTHYYSTKALKTCRGKWYYEATHYAGGTILHLFGFSMSTGHISFYPNKKLTSPSLFLTNDFSNNTGNFVSIQLPVEDEHTVGIGIDANDNIFYVFYKNNNVSYFFQNKKTCQDLNVFVWGTHNSNTNDTVSVNFGDKPFSYNIAGFKPWSKIHETATRQYQKRIVLTIFIISLIIST